MSLRLTPSAHKKKRLVIRTNGGANRRSVSGADAEEDGPALPAEVITMVRSAPDQDGHTRHPHINVAPSHAMPETTTGTQRSTQSHLPQSFVVPAESSKQFSAA